MLLLDFAPRRAVDAGRRAGPPRRSGPHAVGTPLIAEGQSHRPPVSATQRPGPYQIQAAINAVHSDAPTAAATDWRQIVELYDQLLALAPSPVVALNRAVAVAEVEARARRCARRALASTRSTIPLLPRHPRRSARGSAARRGRPRVDAALARTENEAERAPRRRRETLSNSRRQRGWSLGVACSAVPRFAVRVGGRASARQAGAADERRD